MLKLHIHFFVFKNFLIIKFSDFYLYNRVFILMYHFNNIKFLSLEHVTMNNDLLPNLVQVAFLLWQSIFVYLFHSLALNKRIYLPDAERKRPDASNYKSFTLKPLSN